MVRVHDGRAVLDDGSGVPDGDYYTMQEFAIINGVSEEAVRVWKKRGQIDAVEIFGRPYIPVKTEIRLKNKPRFC